MKQDTPSSRWLFPDLLGMDVRHAFRWLIRNPGFTIPAVISLALGIGAVAAVFTLLHAVVLRPLPYPAADRLVRMWSAVPGVGPDARWGLGRPQFLFYRDRARSFDGMGLYVLGSVTLERSGPALRPADEVEAAYVSASLPQVLGAHPALGRELTPEDNLTEDAQVALLSDAYWRREFGADVSVVGRALTVNGRSVRVVGVLQPGARLPEELSSQRSEIGLWMPLHLDPAAAPTGGGHVFRGIARLRPGVMPADALAELASLNAQLPEALPAAYTPEFFRKYGLRPLLLPLSEDVSGGAGRVLWILFGAAGVVLVMAMTNVTSLFFSRLEAKRGETAMREALGARRAHVAQHFVAEMSLVAGTAGLLGLALAGGAQRLLLAVAPPSLPRLGEVSVGWTEAGLTALLALGAVVVLALLPAARHLPDMSALRDARRGAGAPRRRQWTRKTLVVVQVALSLVLLVGAALLFQSFRQLSGVKPGFEPAGVLTFRVAVPGDRYASFESVAAFYRELSSRIESLPGAGSVGLTSSLPLSGFDGCSSVFVNGNASAPLCVPVHIVTPGFFRALGIPVRGRAPEWADVQAGSAGVVVSEALAKRLWPGETAVGKLVGTRSGGDLYPVVGTVAGVREQGLDQPPSEALYIPLLPAAGVEALMGGPPRNLRVAVRTRGPRPELLTPAIQGTLADLDPSVAMADTRLMREIVAGSMSRVSFAALLLGLACAVALVLSLVGMYGVMSYLTAQRQAEIGIRLALGASSRQVARIVLSESLRLATLGVVAGLALALAATGTLRSLLFEVHPVQPATLAFASLLLVVMALAASYVPTVRAIRVNPAELLRRE